MLLTNESAHSTSSTYAARDLLKPAGPSPLSLQQTQTVTVAPTPPKKTVRFNEESNRYYEDKVRTKTADCREAWYSRKEYSHIYAKLQEQLHAEPAKKETQRKAGNNKKAANSSFSHRLQVILKLMARVDFALDDVSCILTPRIQRVIEVLYKNDDEDERSNWMGLELYLPNGLRHESKKRRTWLRMVVSDIQGEYRQGLWNEENIHEELRESCRNYSQTFALFAQCLGQAQAAAVAE